MPSNTLNSDGLTVEQVADILNDLTNGKGDAPGLLSIYGSDINLNSNSPDGQLLNIYAQVLSDMLELLVAVYNSFSPSSAFGTQLDQRVALNGMARKQGTYTQAQVNITVSGALTLYGQDQSVQPVFTVSDNAGNPFQLKVTYAFTGAGTETLTFQAVDIGEVQTLPNTITNQVTNTVGVTGVNNPSTASDVIGVNEETDAQLRVRFASSYALAAVGPADTVQATLLAVPDITDALVIENNTDGTVGGVPANSIWCIVTGGTAAEIGAVIYAKKSLGCATYGGQGVTVTRSNPNAGTITYYYDNSISQPLYIAFKVVPKAPNLTISPATYPTALAATLGYKLGQNPSIGDIIEAMSTIDPNAVVTFVSNQGVSTDGSTYVTGTVSPTGPQYYFTVSAANITVTT